MTRAPLIAIRNAIIFEYVQQVTNYLHYRGGESSVVQCSDEVIK
ncbi:hypothetical protein SAMN05421858_4808 [Haladaptatus litoreus]|uniref:Uncharacterized protein n=1 Tax=Haladaptatus litoreus TaxID=553468 RepID=A0A1N7F8H5_9EURY|nr:hypothetical protein SAMN05421858_4808 [Haladaptatus litoreus]